jgi:hypothetical protein
MVAFQARDSGPGNKEVALVHVRCRLQNWKLRSIFLLTVLGVFQIGTAFSQVTPAAGVTPPDDTPSVKLGGVFYGGYTYTAKPQVLDVDGNTVNPNTFDVTRTYINITGQISHIVAFRFTPDISRATGSTASNNNSLVYRVKYAFGQFNLDDWTGNWKQTWVRLGATQTPFVDWEEGVYRYRFQGTVFSERVGRLTSSDFGLAFHTNLPDNYGEIHTGVYDGEGYSQAETVGTNFRKAVQTRVTIRPLPKGGMLMRGLRLTGFYNWDSYAKNDPRERFVFNALFEHPHLVAGYDYLDALDQVNAASPTVHGRGYSIWATPILKEKGNGWELLLRWDSYTPSRGAVDSTGKTIKQNTWIVGPAYWFPHVGSVAASLLFDVENVTFPGTSLPAQRRYALHGNLSF